MKRQDYRVSVKSNNRAFVGIITSIYSRKYVIPLTSQTTEERKKEGKRKRSSLITSFITESSGKEIANLLYNNMIPVYDEIVSPIVISSDRQTYELNEIRYLRKNWLYIQEKAVSIYNERYNDKSHNYNFLCMTCCDYKKLEEFLEIYKNF